jgi:Ca2+-binding EF-hand superfamily protein
MKRALVLLLASGSAFAAGFEAMDSDADGGISEREHAIAAAGMFRAMDADGDGKVTAEEMPSSPGMSAADKMKAVDADGDGVLTFKEHVRASRAMFLKMDQDKDDSLSRAEFDAGHAVLAKQ